MMKSEINENKVVLSYYDSLLYQSDVNLLQRPLWLNDAIIGFYFEYLGQKYKSSKFSILFISPEVTQLLRLNDLENYSIFLDPNNAKEKDFIFFPVNDCDSKVSAGGSHWSLMIFSRPEKACFYFDSSRSLINSSARNFSKQIMHYLMENDDGHFIEIACPQQDNGYDCGIFVLCFAEVISEHVHKTSKANGCNYDDIKTLVSEKRKSLVNLIHNLQESKTVYA